MYSTILGVQELVDNTAASGDEAAKEGMELQDLVMAVDARDDDLARSPAVFDTATAGSDADRHSSGRCDR